MKFFSKIVLFTSVVALLFTACSKVDNLTKIDPLPVYKSGLSPVLSSSVTAIAASPADSNKNIVTFSWTNPKYSTDSATIKYVVEIDSTGRNFSKSVSRVISGALSTTYTAKEINTIVLGFGFEYNKPYDVDVRITSSYANNNEQYKSNTVKIKVTPYVIPPKVAPPTSGHLFLVGDASQGGWNNPVPVPTQEFAKIDSVTYGGVFNINGGNQYLVLPVNGDWSHKYSVNNTDLSGLAAGGDFGYDLAKNFPAPAASGWYTIVFSFQTGKFSVTPFTGVLPTNLYIVGDATNGGWNNPVPVPGQQLTRINSSVFELSLPLTGGKEYLLLPVNGDWTHKYAVADNSIAGLSAGGNFGYDFAKNFPAPATSGTYKISVNFVTGKFTVK